MAIVLGFMLLSLVAFHVITDELVIHSVSFVGTVAVIGFHTIRLVKSRTLPGSAARRQVWGMVRFGAGQLSNPILR